MPLFRRGAQTVLFVHIPKTGGTSIKEAFKAAGWIEALRMQEDARAVISQAQLVTASHGE
jgi:hypothetical protein